MKRFRSALVAALLVAIAAPASAQPYTKIFGVKAGVSVAGLRDLDDTFDSENQTGFGAGLFYTIGQGVFSLQPEVNFTNKSFEISDPIDSFDLDLLYMQPAVLVKAGIPLAALRPSLQAGVGYGFQVSCDVGDLLDCDDDIDPQNEFVGIFGADIEIWLGALAIVADGRYELGFSEISNAGDIVDDPKSNAWIFRVGLGYRH